MTLAVHDLRVTREGQAILHGIALALRPGEVTIVIGPNGAGKSTFIRALAGLVAHDGRVTLDGVDVATMAPRQRATRIGVFLDPPDATFGFSARELVMMGRFPHLGGSESADDRRRADDALARLEVGHLAERSYARLSSGEKQRVGIARLLCQDTPVVLLDEPTSRLDPYHALRLAELMRALAREDRIVLAAEHDLDLAAQVADRLVILRGGQVVADGHPSLILTPERIAEVYGVRARRVDDGRPSIVIERS